ncbi:nucleotidyltransferase domain-containing protein [Hydrogenimonas urashimensis]|uniref:nucleotidyltransferase domain-containing protein n=1 Tax=Hydrogenimonas urashimensis TaxID=2740515 RepID=UPI0019154E5F|nr:nucleotidyltransferase family protein [Hydrogenimonas urashimensis]
MKTPTDYHGGYWPSQEDTYLLEAILLPKDAALEAWEKWLRTVNYEALQEGPQRMFPLLYMKLRKEGVEHPLMQRFKGIYRRAWYKNQMTFHRIRPLMEALDEAGVRTVILKGAAMIALYYRDLGLRPMNDFDFLIRLSDVAKALPVLKKEGYEPIDGTWEMFDEELFYFMHGFGFRHTQTGQELDLHWHLLRENCGTHDDDALWQRVQPVDFNGFSTYTLDATDHLMHTCVHGLEWNPVASIRWIADAKTIIDNSEIDWPRLLDDARTRHVVLPLLYSLRYLWERFHASIPEDALTGLEAIEPKRIEYYRDAVKRYGENLTFKEELLKRIYMYLNYVQARSKRPYAFLNPVWAFSFLKLYWRLSSIWQIPGELAGLSVRVFKRAVT